MKTKLLILALLIPFSGFGQQEHNDTFEFVGIVFYPAIQTPEYLYEGKFITSETANNLHRYNKWTSLFRDTTSVQVGWLVYLSSHGKLVVIKNARQYTLTNAEGDESVYYNYQEFQTKKGKIIPNDAVIHFKPNK